jgi:TolB-like protein
MRALCLSVLFFSSACATVLRGSNRDVTIYGPDGLQAFNGAEQVPLQVQDRAEGHVQYVANVDRRTEKLTLRSPVRTAQAPLETHVAAGWVVADVLLFWPVLFVDLATQAWRSYDDITFAAGPAPLPAVVVAPPPPAPPPTRTAPPPSGVVAMGPVPYGGKPIIEQGKLAVLDFTNYAKDLSKEDVHYFADVVRGATLKAAPRVEVMTRENLLVLLQATGKDASNCEGECEVDTGRRIGADAVISGEVLKVGSRYKISLKLHETHEGRLLSTGVASGKTIDELDEKLQAAAAELLAPR